MTPKTIRPLAADSTKQEEIDHLRAFAQTIAPGCYLATLISEDFVSWAESQIRADVSPDIMELVDGLRASEQQLTHVKAEAALTEAAYQRQVERLTNENSANVAQYEREAAALREGNTAVWRDLQDHAAAADALETKLIEAQRQIANLKVAIFNLQNPELA